MAKKSKKQMTAKEEADYDKGFEAGYTAYFEHWYKEDKAESQYFQRSGVFMKHVPGGRIVPVPDSELFYAAGYIDGYMNSDEAHGS